MQLASDILALSAFAVFGAFGIYVLLTLLLERVDVWREKPKKQRLLNGLQEYKEPKAKCPYCRKTESKDEPHDRCTRRAAAKAKKKLFQALKDLEGDKR